MSPPPSGQRKASGKTLISRRVVPSSSPSPSSSSSPSPPPPDASRSCADEARVTPFEEEPRQRMKAPTRRLEESTCDVHGLPAVSKRLLPAKERLAALAPPHHHASQKTPLQPRRRAAAAAEEEAMAMAPAPAMAPAMAPAVVVPRRPSTSGGMTTYRAAYGMGTPRTHPWTRDRRNGVPLSLSLQLTNGAHAPDPARGGHKGGPFALTTSVTGPPSSVPPPPSLFSSSSSSSGAVPMRGGRAIARPQQEPKPGMAGQRRFGAKSAVHRDFFSNTGTGENFDGRFQSEKFYEMYSMSADFPPPRTPSYFWRR